MKKDSRRKSALEVTFDVALGMTIATALNYIVTRLWSFLLFFSKRLDNLLRD